MRQYNKKIPNRSSWFKQINLIDKCYSINAKLIDTNHEMQWDIVYLAINFETNQFPSWYSMLLIRSHEFAYWLGAFVGYVQHFESSVWQSIVFYNADHYLVNYIAVQRHVKPIIIYSMRYRNADRKSLFGLVAAINVRSINLWWYSFGQIRS